LVEKVKWLGEGRKGLGYGRELSSRPRWVGAKAALQPFQPKKKKRRKKRLLKRKRLLEGKKLEGKKLEGKKSEGKKSEGKKSEGEKWKRPCVGKWKRKM
jgi:hypothetical protein